MPNPLSPPNAVGMPGRGGPFQVGVGSMQMPGATNPGQRVSLFPQGGGGAPAPGMGPTGPMAPAGGGGFDAGQFMQSLAPMLQGMLGVGSQPPNEVRMYSQSMQALGRNLVGTMEDALNAGKFLGDVFKTRA